MRFDDGKQRKNVDYISPEMQRRAERIEVLMKREGYKHRKDFAAIIDMEPQNFSRCMRSGKISEKICKRIITAFPDYRIEWLLGYDNIPTHYEGSDVYKKKVVIRLKSGFEMRVDCETFKLKINTSTGELTNVQWDGCKNIRPMFFRLEDVDCIYQTLEEGEADGELIKEGES